MKFAPRPLVVDLVRQATACRRLCVGSGQFPLLYWTNCDSDPKAVADIYQHVPPIPFEDASLDEIYAGHVLEHMSREDTPVFLAECLRCLVPGGRLGVVVPDTREIMTRWLNGSIDCVELPTSTWHAVADLDAVCELFLYSTAQDSRHLWNYDLSTLARLLESAGFTVTGEIDRYRDPRLGTGQWYQCGLDVVKQVAP